MTFAELEQYSLSPVVAPTSTGRQINPLSPAQGGSVLPVALHSQQGLLRPSPGRPHRLVPKEGRILAGDCL